MEAIDKRPNGVYTMDLKHHDGEEIAEKLENIRRAMRREE